MKTTKKVLILTYYWPPSGGAGVQRWLKVSHYLAEQGIEVHVLTPKEESASYTVLDPSLNKEIHQNITIHQTKSFEPINLYSRIFGKKSIPTAGFGNANKKNWKQQLIISLRTNLFTPDPRKYWKIFAYSKAKSIIKTHSIKNIITSSPPHSVQLIGMKLKKNMPLNWIVDFRDMWTDIYYYELMNQSRYSHRKNLFYEKKVIEHSDHIITASPVYISFFASKSDKVNESKFTSIPNGYDPKDFQEFKHEKNKSFVITYTGTISEQYNIKPFLAALKKFKETNVDKQITLQFVGSVYPSLMQEISTQGLSDNTKFSPYVPHSESIKFLERSSLLLVCGPLNNSGHEGGIPAKVYEYLAARKPIIYIGKTDGHVASILKETSSGDSFDQNVQEIHNSIAKRYQNWLNGEAVLKPNKKIEKYSRVNQATIFKQLLK